MRNNKVIKHLIILFICIIDGLLIRMNFSLQAILIGMLFYLSAEIMLGVLYFCCRKSSGIADNEEDDIYSEYQEYSNDTN